MYKKIPYSDASEILSRYELDQESGMIVRPEMTVDECLKTLATNKTFLGLINFISHALPVREAVCWAAFLLEKREPEYNHAIKLVRKWIKEPTEKARLNCQKEAEKLGTDHAAGWLCLAVNWNGSGSIVAEDLPVVLPTAFLHSKAIFGCVALLAPFDDNHRSEFITEITTVARSIANGGWPGIKLS